MATHIYKEKISQQPNQVVHRYEEKTVDAPHSYTTRSSGANIMYILLDVVEVILAIRFIFKLLAANSASPFVSFMYAITNPLVAPFRGIFANVQGGPGFIEWATIVAMVVYAIIAYVIAQLIENTSRPVTR